MLLLVLWCRQGLLFCNWGAVFIRTTLRGKGENSSCCSRTLPIRGKILSPLPICFRRTRTRPGQQRRAVGSQLNCLGSMGSTFLWAIFWLTSGEGLKTLPPAPFTHQPHTLSVYTRHTCRSRKQEKAACCCPGRELYKSIWFLALTKKCNFWLLFLFKLLEGRYGRLLLKF